MCSLDGLTNNSDSGAEVDTFFEGTEKLLEIWFDFENSNNNNNEENNENINNDNNNNASNNNCCDLRLIPKTTLDAVLDICKVKIISQTKSICWDSYVLSESSLFISKDRIILKTCGSTTLLLGIKPFLDAAVHHTSAKIIKKLFYSRKSMLKPNQQFYPHFNFESETDYLKKSFPTGLSHNFGINSIDPSNEWVVFIYEAESSEIRSTSIKSIKNCTAELLMSDLDSDAAAHFYRQPNDILTVPDTTTNSINLNNESHPENSPDSDPFSIPPNSGSMFYRSGLVTCFKKSDIIDFTEFHPQGLSVNAVNDEYYHTIHVTPQPLCSYASYETNLCDDEIWLSNLCTIVSVFKPKSFVMDAFVFEKFDSPETFFSGYKLDHFDNLKTSDYQIFYGFYVKSA